MWKAQQYVVLSARRWTKRDLYDCADDAGLVRRIFALDTGHTAVTETNQSSGFKGVVAGACGQTRVVYSWKFTWLNKAVKDSVKSPSPMRAALARAEHAHGLSRA